MLVEDAIGLPEEPWTLTARELEVLYISHGLNTRQIAMMARVSHSTIIEHMKQHGIVRSRKKTGFRNSPPFWRPLSVEGAVSIPFFRAGYPRRGLWAILAKQEFSVVKPLSTPKWPDDSTVLSG